MLETLMASGGNKYIPWSGPGNKTLLKGNQQLGYFGAVSDNELFPKSVFWSISPSLTGSKYNEPGGWLKFIVDGRVLFIKRYNIMRSMNWQMLYDAGAVYGVRGPGPYPTPANGPVDQFRLFIKTETISGAEKKWPLKLRLLTGANDFINNTNDWLSDKSEWDRTLVNVTNGVFDTLNWTEMMGGVAGYNPIQEFTSDLSRMGERGYPNVNGKYAYPPAQISDSFWWRPVLELITDPNFALEPTSVQLVPVGATIKNTRLTFTPPADIAKDIVDFAAYTSRLHAPLVVMSTPQPIVNAETNGGVYKVTAAFSNTDLMVPLSDVVVKATALLDAEVRVFKGTVRVNGTNATSRGNNISTSIENTIKPVQDVVAQRGDLQYPAHGIRKVNPWVDFQNEAKVRIPDVRFTVE